VDKKLKTEWVKALCSGKYKQGTKHLIQLKENDLGKLEPLHCCLGVLCDVANKRAIKWHANK